MSLLSQMLHIILVTEFIDFPYSTWIKEVHLDIVIQPPISICLFDENPPLQNREHIPIDSMFLNKTERFYKKMQFRKMARGTGYSQYKEFLPLTNVILVMKLFDLTNIAYAQSKRIVD